LEIEEEAMHNGLREARFTIDISGVELKNTRASDFAKPQ
jgi:hypothetical protein